MDAIDRLSGFIRSRRALLVLDTCEHLVDAVAVAAHRLLQACPNLILVATSREPLGVTGEVVWRVPPMTVDDDGEGDAVALFAERARAVRANFAVSEANREAVATLARVNDQFDDIRAALAWACSDPERASAAVAIVGSLGMYRLLHGRLREGIDWCREALAAEPDPSDDADRLRARWALVNAEFFYGLDRARVLEEAAVVAADAAAAGLTVIEARCRGLIALAVGLAEPRAAAALLDEAVGLADEAGDDFSRVDNRYNRGCVHPFRGAFAAARA